VSISTEDVIELLRRLAPVDRLRAISEILPELSTEMSAERARLRGDDGQTEMPQDGAPRESLLGLWKGMGFDVSEEDIAEARREMWGNFPRDDF